MGRYLYATFCKNNEDKLRGKVNDKNKNYCKENKSAEDFCHTFSKIVLKSQTQFQFHFWQVRNERDVPSKPGVVIPQRVSFVLCRFCLLCEQHLLTRLKRTIIIRKDYKFDNMYSETTDCIF